VALFLLANLVRWWAIRTLGVHWTVHVMDASHLDVVHTGPYRLVRNPNYAAVFVELGTLPVIHGAWITALVGSIGHVWVLRQRVGLEHRLLSESATYREAMRELPNFVPSLVRLRRVTELPG
jgi:methyltransferase